MTTILALILIAILFIIFGWHFLFAGAFVITATVWAIVVASVVFFSIGILLLFILTGMSVIVIGAIALIWAVLALILFPILLPVILPLFIILLFISYIRRRQQKK